MLNLVRGWILLSAWLVGCGWILSACHQLNRAGYALTLSPLALIWLLWLRKSQSRPFSCENFRRLGCKFSKRFRRRAPQIFLLIAGLSFLGGCLYSPVDYDTDAYRLPRVLHWLWAGHWHLIHTVDARLNIAGCGMEWLWAPVILFSHTDRLLFLFNWISYLMLPGLVFSVFTQLQVRPRVAWWWSWLLSSGLCFALQAGSVANDGFAAVYILAAVDLALRARVAKSVCDLWLSLLAAALVTGLKQTNIPLFALWFIAAWPAFSLFKKNPGRTAIVIGFGLLVSIVPISLLNCHYYGTWMPLDAAGITVVGKFQLNPFWGIIGNAFCIPIQNLVPPFYSLLPPFYSYWLVLWDDLMRQFASTALGAHFTSFENFGFLAEVRYHGISEANAGIGLGICIMILATLHISRRLRKNGGGSAMMIEPVPILRLLRLAPWGLLLVFMAKDGAYENARQLAPYYLFLFPIWLIKSGHSQVTREQPWQRLALGMMIATALLLVAISERPLFPAQTVFKLVQAKFPNSEFLSDECVHYLESHRQVLAARRNYVQTILPPSENVVGYYDKHCFIDEPSLWLPYGHRQVECLLPDDPPERLRSLGIHFVVINGNAIRQTSGGIGEWLDKYNASITGQFFSPRPARPASEPPDLYIVHLN